MAIATSNSYRNRVKKQAEMNLLIYSRFDDEQKKNALCKPIDAPHLPSQWFQLQYISNLNGQLIGKALGKVIETN